MNNGRWTKTAAAAAILSAAALSCGATETKVSEREVSLPAFASHQMKLGRFNHELLNIHDFLPARPDGSLLALPDHYRKDYVWAVADIMSQTSRPDAVVLWDLNTRIFLHPSPAFLQAAGKRIIPCARVELEPEISHLKKHGLIERFSLFGNAQKKVLAAHQEGGSAGVQAALNDIFGSIDKDPEIITTSVVKEDIIAALFSHALYKGNNSATAAQAKQAYEEVLELDPLHRPALINLGAIHVRMESHRAAEGYLSRAMAIESQDPESHFNLGRVLHDVNSLRAIDAYKQAVLLQSDHFKAHRNIALLYEKMENPTGALAHWRAYVQSIIQQEDLQPEDWKNEEEVFAHAIRQIDKAETGNGVDPTGETAEGPGKNMPGWKRLLHTDFRDLIRAVITSTRGHE